MTVRVLLVDDVADVRRLVRIALRFHGGFEVVGEAGAGLQAIELATRLRPDIVLLDLGLPDLAGRDVLTRVREVVPGAKVVVFTGADDEDRAYYEEHTAGYVLKSAELDYLVELLDDVGRTADRNESARFDADASSVPLAREFVRRWLSECGAEHLFDEASLVVTELAANAVLHARLAVRGPAQPGRRRGPHRGRRRRRRHAGAAAVQRGRRERARDRHRLGDLRLLGHRRAPPRQGHLGRAPARVT